MSYDQLRVPDGHGEEIGCINMSHSGPRPGLERRRPKS